MTPIVTPAEMAVVDASAPQPVSELIDRAGRAVARTALAMLGGGYGRVVVVIAGKGNNGADGRVAAAVLRRRGVQVRVIDAAACPAVLPPCDLVVDAAYGTGFRGTWAAPDVGNAQVLAVDIPSGVDALTGVVASRVLAADRTITFQALKPGLVFGAGAQLAGLVDVADIGLDVSATRCHLVDRADVGAWWLRRPVNAHKWNGAVRVVAGSDGMFGAAKLCAAAALRAGAGLVKLSVPGHDVDALPEIVQGAIPATGWESGVLSELHRFGALVIGPGLGRQRATLDAALATIAAADVPVVIDGDGLFALAGPSAASMKTVREMLAARSAPTVITPHDGEFATLTGAGPNADRVAATRTLATELSCVVLLKGPATVVADASGEAFIVDRGDQRLATAGTGDVLSGMIGAALASGVAPLEGAAAAAWLHAESAARRGFDGMIAGDVIDEIPAAIASVR